MKILRLIFWRGKKLFQKDFKFTLFSLPIEMKFPLFEKEDIDYEVFGGMIFMELTNNHLEIILNNMEKDFSNNNQLNKIYTNILQYLSPENKRESKVIITIFSPIVT